MRRDWRGGLEVPARSYVGWEELSAGKKAGASLTVNWVGCETGRSSASPLIKTTMAKASMRPTGKPKSSVLSLEMV